MTTTDRCIIVVSSSGSHSSVVICGGAAPSGGIGMNWELIKHKLCRLIATTAILLAGAMVSAAAAGSMPLWAALLGLFASVVLLNAVCGIRCV